jgi:predicted DNA binding protein
LSNRIVNLMAAEKFFNRKRNKHEIKRLEAERFTLTPVQARRKIKPKTQKKYTRKVSTPDIDFTERQMQIAIEALQKGKP